MPVRRSHAAIRCRAVAIAAMLTTMGGLAGCSPGANQFAPACPAAALLPQAADLSRYRPSTHGGGHDLTDLLLQGRVTRVDGKCEPGGDSHTLDATVTVTIEITHGPAAPTRVADIPYFVAVADGDRILDKRVFSNRVAFPPNVDRIYLTSDPVEMRLPIGPNKSGAAYTVWAGFQLTPDEMAQAQPR
jgi:hypothetical protein